MPVRRLSHIGLCVSDLARSRAFYCDGLGFRERSDLHAEGAMSDQLLGLSGARLHAVYLERDGVRLELLHYPKPGDPAPPVASESPRPMNAPGFTHWSFRVADLKGVVGRLEALGGRTLHETDIFNPDYEAGAIFMLDPDGTRLELLESPGPIDALPGEDR